LDWNEQDSPLSGKWKTTTTVDESSESTGQVSPVITTSPPLTGHTSQQLTLCVEGSPVSPSVVPGSREALKMTVTSGQRWFDAYKQSGPLGSLVRMCLDSSTWASNKCVLTWRPLVIKQQFLGFRLVRLMHRMSDNDFGYWRTPTVSEYESPSKQYMHSTRARYPDGRECQPKLADVVKLWPTMVSSDTGSRKHRYSQGGLALSDAAGGQLNPNWVEWLMGYPIGWTDLEPSATPLSRKSQKR
jgi:hypothetical protein